MNNFVGADLHEKFEKIINSENIINIPENNINDENLKNSIVNYINTDLYIEKLLNFINNNFIEYKIENSDGVDFIDNLIYFYEKVKKFDESNYFKSIKKNGMLIREKLEEIKSIWFKIELKEQIYTYLFNNKGNKEYIKKLLLDFQFHYFLKKTLLNNNLKSFLRDLKEIKNFLDNIDIYYTKIYELKKYIKKYTDNNLIIQGIVNNYKIYHIEISFKFPFKPYKVRTINIEDKEAIEKTVDEKLLLYINKIHKI